MAIDFLFQGLHPGDGRNSLINNVVSILKTCFVIAFLYLSYLFPSHALALTISIYLVLWILANRKMTNVPSVQGGLPILGQALKMIAGSPWDMMTRWASEYGNLYKFKLFGLNYSLAVSDKDVLRVVLHSNVQSFVKDLDWTYEPFLCILGTGLVTSEAESWKRQRFLLVKHFKNDILELIPNMALDAFGRLSAKLFHAQKSGEVMEMAEEFRHMTLQVIAEAILSISAAESDANFAKMYYPIVEEGHKRTWNPVRQFFPITSDWWEFRKNVNTLNNYVTSLITNRWDLKQREKSSGQPITRPLDVLDKCLDAIKPQDWNDAFVNQIRDEVKTFILAGHETSASMLTWSLYELSCHPEYLKRVRDEASEVFKGFYDPVSKSITELPPLSTLSKLVYTECCLRESLRKYSNVPTVVRVATKDIDAGKLVIPKGTHVFVNMQGVHHDPEKWPEPLKYIPDRFLEPIDYWEFKFLPFIAGPRECIGQYLSLLESKILLALLVLNFSFEVTNPESAGIKHSYMVPIIPKDGHRMKISIYNNPTSGTSSIKKPSKRSDSSFASTPSMEGKLSVAATSERKTKRADTPKKGKTKSS